MRLLLERPVEVGGRHQLAEIGIALLVLRQKRQPVDRRLAADIRGAAPRRASRR